MAGVSEKSYPFSNGTEFLDWNCTNCCRCVRGGEDGQGAGCDIADALQDARFGDGSISEEISKRMKLERWHNEDGICVLCWPCGEFEIDPAIAKLEASNPRAERGV